MGTSDALLAERSSLASSHAMLDEFTAVAGSVLGSLRTQRGVLKSAHRKILNVASTLGLSNSVMRIIERRTTADKILVYGGMVLITLLLLVVRFGVFSSFGASSAATSTGAGNEAAAAGASNSTLN
jgi:Golgi SNAP receptor complex protein 2